MRIKTQDYDDLTVIELEGELTGDFVEMLKKNFDDTVAKRKIGIILDLGQVPFVDSHGLEFLLWARDFCIENSCALKLAALSENCEKILEITLLDKEFDRYAQLTDAVKSLA